jgi:hypothetical protein
VRSIVEDDAVYDQLKLFARFTRLAGYKGLLVCCDELVNLLKIPHAGARNSNYEQLLRIVNDVLQGTADGLGFVFGGTPESLTDVRRGLFSYAALETRLQENAFAKAHGVDDVSGPVIRLTALSPEDLFVLLTKLRNIQASGDPAKYLVPDEALHAFLAHCSQRIGASYFQTPRNTIRAFLDLLAVLETSPESAWTDLIAALPVHADIAPIVDDETQTNTPQHASSSVDGAGDDAFATFRL